LGETLVETQTEIEGDIASQAAGEKFWLIAEHEYFECSSGFNKVCESFTIIFSRAKISLFVLY